MSIDVFRQDSVQKVIKDFGKTRIMNVFVGAGASVEAGLPLWEQLVQRLLDRAACEAQLFEHDGEREEWVDSMLRVESLMGAASVVEGLLGDRLPGIVREELFRGPKRGSPLSAEDYFPGPTAMQIAYLREVFDSSLDNRKLHIYTTNYDDLLEVALKSRPLLTDRYKIYPYTAPGREPQKPLKVRHLHGYLGRDSDLGKVALTLTEKSYFGRGTDELWQDYEVIAKLNEAPSLFLGTSLTDVNLTRYLYRQQGNENHAVVFVRQAEIYDVPDSVRKVRENVATDRWKSEHLDVIFVDHFSDVAQLVYEIARYRSSDSALYVPLPMRFASYFEPLAELIQPDNGRVDFVTSQRIWNKALTDILEEGRASLAQAGLDLSRERGLAACLWLLEEHGQYLTAWGATDRLHTQVSGLEIVELNPESQSAAVRAFCSGVFAVAERNYRYARWSYMVGIPLFTNSRELGRVPIGALTVTTQTPSDQSVLAHMGPEEIDTFTKVFSGITLGRVDAFRLATIA